MHKLRASKFLFFVLVFLPAITYAADPSADVDAMWNLAYKWYFNFVLPLGSILAGIVVLIGGIVYITSGGDSTKTGKAKELIFGALTGLIILICASLIIRTLIG